jgi:Leucine-rich repeat (LRR) protein
VKCLKLSNGGLSDRATSCVDFSGLSALDVLDLRGNKFSRLPSGIGFLPKLRTLDVGECEYLVSIPDLPSSLEFLFANDCKSLKRVRMSIDQGEKLHIFLPGSYSLEEIQGIEGLSNYLWYIGVHNHDSHSPNKLPPNKLQKSVVEVLFLSISLAQ